MEKTPPRQSSTPIVIRSQGDLGSGIVYLPILMDSLGSGRSTAAVCSVMVHVLPGAR
jgi:hypothetical protein